MAAHGEVWRPSVGNSVAACGEIPMAAVTGIITVRRTVSSGEVVELAKTSRSRRQVPLSPRAVEALEEMPARLDTPLLFPAERGGLLNLDNFRSREWAPAIEAGAVRTPARIYDLRSTFASNAIGRDFAAVIGPRVPPRAGDAGRRTAWAQETLAREREPLRHRADAGERVLAGL